MDEFFKALILESKPFVSGIGAIVVIYSIVYKRLPFMPAKPERLDRRQQNDEVLRLVVSALQDNASANHDNAKANHEIAEALRANGTRIDTLSQRLEEFANEVRKAISEIHRRIDGLVERK